MFFLQLRVFERDGVIHREVYKQVPPKVEYSLTEFGRTLEPITFHMKDWREKYRDKINKIETTRKAGFKHKISKIQKYQGRQNPWYF